MAIILPQQRTFASGFGAGLGEGFSSTLAKSLETLAATKTKEMLHKKQRPGIINSLVGTGLYTEQEANDAADMALTNPSIFKVIHNSRVDKSGRDAFLGASALEHPVGLAEKEVKQEEAVNAQQANDQPSMQQLMQRLSDYNAQQPNTDQEDSSLLSIQQLMQSLPDYDQQEAYADKESDPPKKPVKKSAKTKKNKLTTKVVDALLRKTNNNPKKARQLAIKYGFEV